MEVCWGGQHEMMYSEKMFALSFGTLVAAVDTTDILSAACLQDLFMRRGELVVAVLVCLLLLLNCQREYFWLRSLSLQKHGRMVMLATVGGERYARFCHVQQQSVNAVAKILFSNKPEETWDHVRAFRTDPDAKV